MGKQVGRKRNPIKRLLRGKLYFVDRRHDHFSVYRKIISRQGSRNDTKENRKWFPVRKSPVITTLLVTDHDLCFGKDYVKVLVANSDQETMMGFMSLGEFIRVVTGKLEWVFTYPEP